MDKGTSFDFQKIKESFVNVLKKNKWLIITGSAIALTLIVLLSVFGAEKGKNVVQEEETTTEQLTTEEVTTTDEPETKAPIGKKGQAKSVLTGEWIDEKISRRRPIAVVFGNYQQAVPQVGIEKADIVYECPTEGGIQRFLAIMQAYDELDQIGSVRSARTYFVTFAREHDAIFMHHGQAVYALPVLEDEGTDTLNGMELENILYFRVSDRSMPHNSFARVENIADAIETKGYRSTLSEKFSHFRFMDDDKVNKLSDGVKAHKVVPGYTVNNPWFEYNKEDKLYYRFQYGDIQIDKLTDEQLSYRNIILQYCDYRVLDEQNYREFYTHGSGEGKLITNGKAVDITWEKNSQFGKTQYYYKDTGKKIRLNQGKTWVCLIQSDGVDKIEIE